MLVLKEDVVNEVKNFEVKWEGKEKILLMKIEEFKCIFKGMKEIEKVFVELKDYMLEL